MKSKQLLFAGFWVLVILAAGIALFGVYQMSVIGDANTKTIESMGYNWSYSSPWGDTGYVCNNVVQSHNDLYMEDQSTASLIDIYGRIPNSGSSDCGTYTLTATVRLDDLDLRSVQKVVIRRSVHLQASGKDRDSRLSSNVNGLTDAVIDYDSSLNFGSVDKTYHDIQITNENGAIVFQSDEGRQVIIPTGPLYFTNSVSVSTSDSNGGSLDYTITSVEVTPLPPGSGIPPSSNSNTGFIIAGSVLAGSLIVGGALWAKKKK